MQKRRLVKEGDNYWEPDTGNIYNKDGVLVMHDAVYRKPKYEDKINFNDYELGDRDSCRLYSKDYYKEVPTVTVTVNTDYNKFEYVSWSKRDFDLPTRATQKSAGYDFHSPKDVVIEPGATEFIDLEVKCCVKPGEFLMIVPRSSLGFKGLNHVALTNTTGIIDADYYNNPDNEGVIGKISSLKNDVSDTNIIWTKNQGIVFIIKEFIVHDMYLIDVEENLVEQMKYIYGKGFKRLKDKVLGTNATYMIH